MPGPGQYELKSQFKGKAVHKETATDPENEKAPFGSYLQVDFVRDILFSEFNVHHAWTMELEFPPKISCIMTIALI